MTQNKNLLDIANKCIDDAKKSGAYSVDTVIFDNEELSIRDRLGKTETIERSESSGLGIRVFIEGEGGLKQAAVSTNDLSDKTIEGLIDQVVDMAKVSPVDQYAGLAEKGQFAVEVEDMNICDNNDYSESQFIEVVKEGEAAGLSVDGVTNSDGAEISYSKSEFAIANSNGLSLIYPETNFSMFVSLVSGASTSKETDYDYSVSRHFGSLKNATEIGKRAGELAVGRLNPVKKNTCKVPVVFSRRIARSFLDSFSGFINGAAIARKSSFLQDSMEKQIFSKSIKIVDNPSINAGISSEPFDGEGIKSNEINLVENGVLKSWLLDIRSANQLGLETNGRASRSLSGNISPSSSNLYIENGLISVDELISDIKEGFYVTDVFGMGINGVTGDYSQGAAGFWIENGEILYPVNEMTIAGNLKDMFMNMNIANDLEMSFGTNSPTIRIDGMTIAGS